MFIVVVMVECPRRSCTTLGGTPSSAELCGHVEHAAASDSGELRAIPDERDRCARFGGDGEQRDCGVLVEHPGLVYDYSLTRASRASSAGPR